MWVQVLIKLISSQLTKDIVELLLDEIAKSIKNKATKIDTDKLKEVL